MCVLTHTSIIDTEYNTTLNRNFELLNNLVSQAIFSSRTGSNTCACVYVCVLTKNMRTLKKKMYVRINILTCHAILLLYFSTHTVIKREEKKEEKGEREREGRKNKQRDWYKYK